MIHLPFDQPRSLFLVFDPGDEAVETLRAFALAEGIEAGWFSAIGAFSRATIAYWNRDTRAYERIEVAEQVEVLAMNGNVAVEGKETRIHAHVVLGRRDGSTIGGHLVSGDVYPTLELHLSVASGRLTREKNADTLLSPIVR